MTVQERVKTYNSLDLYDKQWLLNVMLENDIVIWMPVGKPASSSLEDGEQYDATINGTRLQLNINVPEE